MQVKLVLSSRKTKELESYHTFAVRHSLMLLWLEMNATLKVTIPCRPNVSTQFIKRRTFMFELPKSKLGRTHSYVPLTSWFIWTLFEEVEPSQWTISVDLRHFTHWILLRTSTKVCMWLWHAQLPVKEGEISFDFIVFGKNRKLISLGFRRTARGIWFIRSWAVTIWLTEYKNQHIYHMKWCMKCFIYWTADLKLSKPWSSQWWSWLTWFQIRSSIYETFYISLHIHSSRAH